MLLNQLNVPEIKACLSGVYFSYQAQVYFALNRQSTSCSNHAITSFLQQQFVYTSHKWLTCSCHAAGVTLLILQPSTIQRSIHSLHRSGWVWRVLLFVWGFLLLIPSSWNMISLITKEVNFHFSLAIHRLDWKISMCQVLF